MMNMIVVRNRTAQTLSRGFKTIGMKRMAGMPQTKSFSPFVSLIYPMQSNKLMHRYLSTTSEDSAEKDYTHFKISSHKHPLEVKKISSWVDKMTAEAAEEMKAADHTGRQQNHIWSKEELEEAMSTLYRHQPKSFSDHVMNKLMYGLYYTFNFITGYKPNDPSVNSIEWRLIVLESVAGVPGFVAAGFRHFHSLRMLKRDYGWIATLLEEAENERMHLLVCLKMFKASMVTRTLVVATQVLMTPFLMAVYAIHPKSMHRFVGYLEETACHTYVNVINHIETPGTQLNKAWSDLPAPPIAIGYWKLGADAKWVDTLKCMMADESHHRDVNHTFADMKSDDPNPFLDMHKENAMHAWRLENKGEVVHRGYVKSEEVVRISNNPQVKHV